MELKWIYQVICRAWRVMIFCTVVPGVIALALSLAMRPTYEAQADVALYKTKAAFVFDPSFVSLSEDDLVNYSNPDARRNTLAALASSGQVLSETLALLPEALRADWSLSNLEDAIDVDTSGNLIQLSVEAHDPQIAAAICNAWAEAFVARANRTFGQPEDASVTVAEQASLAYDQYTTTQAALQTFLEDNPMDELRLAIGLKETAVLNIVGTYQVNAQTTLKDLLLARSRLPLLIGNAQVLRQTVAASGAAQVDLSTRLSALLLQVGGLTSGVAVPAELQFTLPAPSEAVLSRSEALAMLDQIIAELTSLQIVLDDLILASEAEVIAGLGAELAQQIAAIQAELDPLRASLEVENATLTELTAARDLAWSSYQTLERKAAEVAIAAETTETEVVLASRAVTPEEPARPQKLLNTAIGCVFGLLAGLAFVFVREQVAGGASK